MTKSDLQRLVKIEDRIKQIAREKYKLEFDEPEWDIISYHKMLEIMAYRLPTQISNWKYGRDYERQRTIFDEYNSIPYEVVVNSRPPRAYLMETNVFAVQVLVMAHVIGHLAVFKMNKYFQNSRKDILDVLSAANERFLSYERRYGIDAVEKIVDAGHALQLHSTPFDIETEDEIRKRIYEQERIRRRPINTEFSDIIFSKTAHQQEKDIEYENHQLWIKLKNTTPPEPMTDLLRYIIDHSNFLDDWEKDILEILRIEGQYYWPMYKTKFLHEGSATYFHMKIMEDIFDEGLLNNDEHGQYNYANSLVRAQNKAQLNPYLIGSEILFDIEERYNKGKYGSEYEECINAKEKEKWNTNKNKGLEKVLNVIRSYTDWFLIQEFLTTELIDKLDLYFYKPIDKDTHIDYVRTDHTPEQIKEILVSSFAHNFIPEIEIVDGSKGMKLRHRHTGKDLDEAYAKKTLEHIKTLWGPNITLESKDLKLSII